MSVAVGPDEPSPPPVDRAPDRSAATAPPPGAREAVAAVCPYLASDSGSWRAAVPSRDHRCTAVEPATPQSTDKQRRHCLSAAHVDCSLFRAARAARLASLAAGVNPAAVEAADRRRRAVARTAPIVLEPPRLLDQVTRFEFDRAPGQIALVALMVVAFGVVAIARFSAGSPVPSVPPAGSAIAVGGSPRPTPVPTPLASVSAEPSASTSPPPAFRTTYKVKRGDTLSAIASRFKTTAAKIKALNGLKSNTLKVGQVLKIP
jgi:hypothetical protein